MTEAAIASPIDLLLAEIPVGGTCSRCGENFPSLKPAELVVEPQYCRDCGRIHDEAVSIIHGISRHLQALLAGSGMKARERAARLEAISEGISARLPQETVKQLLAGAAVQRGFGISGPHDRGKTMAIAALLAEASSARILARAAAVGARALDRWFLWLSWPDAVNRIRVMSVGEDGVRQVDKLLQSMYAVELLVLDDVGAERIRGDFQEDAAASKLELVVDERNRELLPIVYTTNLDHIGLKQLYGLRLFRRLEEAAETVVVP